MISERYARFRHEQIERYNTRKKNFREGVKLAKRNYIGFVFLLPFFALFFTFTILPVFMAIFYSFTDFNILQRPNFVGLRNYVQLFLHDEIFITAIRNTFVFAVITGPIGYILSLLVAWFINELHPRVRAVMILLFYAPSISGQAFLIWRIMFSSDAYGYINSLLLRFNLINNPIQFMEDPTYILPIVILVSLWLSLGTGFLAFVAGLQGVDKTLYEAGSVDGIRNRWQELWFITLPSMRPQLMFGAVISITAAFAVFDVSVAMAGFPSVQYAAHTVLTHLVDYGTIRFEMGYASTIAVFLFFLMVGSNKLVNKYLRKIGT